MQRKISELERKEKLLEKFQLIIKEKKIITVEGYEICELLINADSPEKKELYQSITQNKQEKSELGIISCNTTRQVFNVKKESYDAWVKKTKAWIEKTKEELGKGGESLADPMPIAKAPRISSEKSFIVEDEKKWAQLILQYMSPHLLRDKKLSIEGDEARDIYQFLWSQRGKDPYSPFTQKKMGIESYKGRKDRVGKHYLVTVDPQTYSNWYQEMEGLYGEREILRTSIASTSMTSESLINHSIFSPSSNEDSEENKLVKEFYKEEWGNADLLKKGRIISKHIFYNPASNSVELSGDYAEIIYNFLQTNASTFFSKEKMGVVLDKGEKNGVYSLEVNREIFDQWYQHLKMTISNFTNVSSQESAGSRPSEQNHELNKSWNQLEDDPEIAAWLNNKKS